MRTAVLCCVFAAAAYGELPKTDAYVQSFETSPDGRSITAVVKAVRRGQYVLAAGYAIDKDRRFQFYKGGKSKQKAFDERLLKVEAGDTVEVEVKVNLPPPSARARPRVMLFAPTEKVPTSD